MTDSSRGYQQFFAEMKRRRVFRVMAVYGIVGFVLLQIVDLAVPALLLPEWTYRFVALILLLGFPVAIILAWAFEMTPEGVQKTQAAAAGEIEGIIAAPASQRLPAGLMALVGMTALLLGAWWVGTRTAADPGGTTAQTAMVSGLRLASDTSDMGGQECDTPAPEWIWCDDFDRDRTASYFEFNTADGNFDRVAGVGRDGSPGMRTIFQPGDTGVGWLHLAFGRTPQPYFRPVDAGTADYREIYWRVYLRNEAGWIGGGGHKLSRATSFVSDSTWRRSLTGHLWSGNNGDAANRLAIDPASGTDESGNLLDVEPVRAGIGWRWLGRQLGDTPLFDAAHVGEWYCIEARLKLNDAGQSNGVFQYWIDGILEASSTNLNWVGSFDAYGINAIFLENYWNDGAPANQERYMENFVVSTAPIGCL